MYNHYDNEEPPVIRRRVLCGSGASVFGATITYLLGATKPVRAGAICGSTPELDSLAVQIVIDGHKCAVAPGRPVEGVDIQHFGWMPVAL